jgi:hypothetical protein
MSLDELLVWAGALLAIGALLAAAAIGGLYTIWRHFVAGGVEGGQSGAGKWLAFGIEGLFAALILLVEFVFAASLFILRIMSMACGE